VHVFAPEQKVLTGGVDIETTSRLAGGFCWAETQFMEITGERLHHCEDALLTVRLGDRCTRHGEHAEQWAARIASVPHLTPEEVTVADAALAAVLDRLRSCDSDTEFVELLDTVATPVLVDRYSAVRNSIDERIDGPTARLVDRALANLAAPVTG
jgi:hypothetical protein